MYSHQVSKVTCMWKIIFVECPTSRCNALVVNGEGVLRDPNAIAAQRGRVFFPNTCQKMRVVSKLKSRNGGVKIFCVFFHIFVAPLQKKKKFPKGITKKSFQWENKAIFTDHLSVKGFKCTI